MGSVTRHLWMRLFSMIWTVLLPVATVAQSPVAPRPLTLQGAIALAQQRGPAAQVARSTRDNAHDSYDAFTRNLLPQFFLSGNALNFVHGINPVLQPDGSMQFIGQSQNQTSLSAGFSQTIPWTGSTVSVSSMVSRIDLLGGVYSRYYQTSPVVVTLQQDLFKPRTVLWNERVQSLTASVAERGYLEAREDVASATAAAFFDLYTQQMTLANAQANVAVNDTLYTLNQNRFKVGKISENDLLKSELALLRARAAAADAQLARDKAEAVLRDLLAYPVSQSLVIVPPDAIPTVAADPAVAVAQALQHASDMEQNTLDNVTAQEGLETARAANRFTATIAASAGFNQTAGTIGQAYQSPLGAQSLTVGVQLPLVQWGAGHAAVEAAKANAAKVAANNTMRRNTLVEDARFSALQLQQAQRNVVLATKADTVAAQEFAVARDRYTIGKISNTDLYTAQEEKDAAVVAYVQALQTYWTVYYHLRRVTLYDFVTQQPLLNEDRP
jgi:outer membrane protein TolC